MDYTNVVQYKAKLLARIRNECPELAKDLGRLSLPWYRINNMVDEDGDDETTDTTEVLIYDEIGGSFGVSAEEFVRDLQAITTPNIKVRINSPGGSVFDSIAIYNSLVAHSAYVTTYVDAIAASGASIIAQAGDERIVMVGGQLMIHDALGPEMGNAAAHREIADFLDRQSDNIASIYAARAGGEIDEWRTRMLAETWFFASEAVEIGLADAVYSPMKPEEEETEESEDEPTKPAEEPEPEPEPEPDTEALMRRKHRISGRGYRYNGRNVAPPPLAASIRELLDLIPTR